MAKLTEQEQQEIIRYIEADKPLPDKYRFLLFEDKQEVELVWNGKTSEVCNIVLPFQVIEHVDEPRAEKPEDTEAQMFLFDERGRQLKGWTNKLIWGDNKLILSSLKNGPLREEIEAQGGLKLVYIAPKYIPAEVFDKRAVEKNQVVFHDVSFIEVKPHVKKNSAAVELTDFSVFYSQDSIANAEAALKNKHSKIVVEQGQIVKVSKDKNGIVNREVLTKNWTDWIDYWAVDFDFESNREIIRVKRQPAKQTVMPGMEQPEQLELPEYEEVWTGDFIFENEWQSFRTKKDRSLELKSVFHKCAPGRRKIAVKVVDIFGNDTMTIVEVTVGGNR